MTVVFFTMYRCYFERSVLCVPGLNCKLYEEAHPYHAPTLISSKISQNTSNQNNRVPAHSLKFSPYPTAASLPWLINTS